MDTRTGVIHKGSLDELEKKLGHRDLVEIDPADMTEKQKKEGKVSLHDRRSKLGKVLTANQKRNRRRRLKNG